VIQINLVNEMFSSSTVSGRAHSLILLFLTFAFFLSFFLLGHIPTSLPLLPLLLPTLRPLNSCACSYLLGFSKGTTTRIYAFS
jgi:hypothetical protein